MGKCRKTGIPRTRGRFLRFPKIFPWQANLGGNLRGLNRDFYLPLPQDHVTPTTTPPKMVIRPFIMADQTGQQNTVCQPFFFEHSCTNFFPKGLHPPPTTHLPTTLKSKRVRGCL